MRDPWLCVDRILQVKIGSIGLDENKPRYPSFSEREKYDLDATVTIRYIAPRLL